MGTSMIDKAFEKLSDGTDLILYSDHGDTSVSRTNGCYPKSICKSIIQKGNCLNDAVIENFFCLLKTEPPYLREFESMARTSSGN